MLVRIVPRAHIQHLSPPHFSTPEISHQEKKPENRIAQISMRTFLTQQSRKSYVRFFFWGGWGGGRRFLEPWAVHTRPNCWILIIQRKQAIGPNLGKIQPRVRSSVFVKALRLRGQRETKGDLQDRSSRCTLDFMMRPVRVDLLCTGK